MTTYNLNKNEKESHKDGGLLIIWNRIVWSTPELYRVFSQLRIEKEVLCVLPVRKRNVPHFFKVWVRIGSFNNTLRTLKSNSSRYQWLVRENKSYWERKNVGNGLKKTLSIVDRVERTNSIRILSWNINGFSDEKQFLNFRFLAKDLDIVALQETHRFDGEWPLKFKGYKIAERQAINFSCCRGLAILVKNRYIVEPLVSSSINSLAVRVIDPSSKYMFIIVNVHLPSSHSKALWNVLCKDLFHFRRTNDKVDIFVVGDFNISRLRLARKVSKWYMDVRLIEVSGSTITRPNWKVGKTGSDIDHMLLLGPSVIDESLISFKLKVKRGYLGSDHWPILLSIRLINGIGGGASLCDLGNRSSLRGKAFINRKAVQANPVVFLSDNRFSALAEECDSSVISSEFVSSMVTRFSDMCHSVAFKVGKQKGFIPNRFLPVTEISKWKPRFSSKSIRLIRKRRRAFKALKRARTHKVSKSLKRYRKLVIKVRASLRTDSKKAWLLRVNSQVKLLCENNTSKYWKWAKSFFSPYSSSALKPIKNEEGVLAISQKEIVSTWLDYYKKLGNDSSGLSHNWIYDWTSNVPSFVVLPRKRKKLPNMDSDIQWGEVLRALKHVRPNKAPGMDDIPASIYRLIVVNNGSKTDEPELGPSSPFAVALFSILRMVWEFGVIPNSWQVASIVSIYKSGDTLDPSNYRGISLIFVILKLLCLVIYFRVYEGLEASNFFISEQAGFRTKSEAVAQVAALLEILQRRSVANFRSFVLFVDFKKAYDMVPHSALLFKLRRAGICGKVFKLIESLYLNSYFTIGVESEPVLLERGVRQG